MSTTDIEQTPEARESGLLHREFQAEATAGDGRTIDVRIVPYNEVATVDDGRGPYQEEFVRGAFDDQLVASHRLKVWLNFQHQQSIDAIVGRGVALHEEDDGLYGTFRAFEDSGGEKALTLIREGLLDSVSLEFKAKKSIRTAAGVVRRAKAHLSAVALCRLGAYAGAQVLALREEDIEEVTIDEDLLPVEMNPELVARLRAQGVVLPSRYQAHPAATDTSAETDTSEDGTRQHEETESSEEPNSDPT